QKLTPGLLSEYLAWIVVQDRRAGDSCLELEVIAVLHQEIHHRPALRPAPLPPGPFQDRIELKEARILHEALSQALYIPQGARGLLPALPSTGAAFTPLTIIVAGRGFGTVCQG